MEEKYKELLENKEVQAEIRRHLWLESERAGQDIGFETAAEDWLRRFSTAWMQYHLPQKKKIESPLAAFTSKSKTRRASSYL